MPVGILRLMLQLWKVVDRDAPAVFSGRSSFQALFLRRCSVCRLGILFSRE